jgi:hypothetical protein
VKPFLCLLLLGITLRPALADDSQKIASLVKETQKLVTDANTLAVALWIPSDLFAEVLKNNTRITDDTKKDLLKTEQDYVVIGLVDAKKGGQAGLSFTSQDDVLKTAKLTAPGGQTLAPLTDASLPPTVQSLVGTMKPMFAGMMGRLGQNLLLIVFPNKDSGGKKVADPLGEGRLTFVENEHSFSWRLPLASLLPEKVCPECGEHLPGNYKYCPYDGTKLPD